MNDRRVYFDHNATTPIHPEVRESMLPYIGELFGNPSSGHWAGREVHDAAETARSHVARLINASPSEIIFTSGGTESDNMAIRGALIAGRARGRHVITTSVEHPAVYKTCKILEAEGMCELTVVPVDGQGMIDPDLVQKAIRPDTVLISAMYANNETGTVLPLAELSRIGREHGVLVHTDAVQAVGKVPLDAKALGVDMLSASGHKFNAPKGVGFQYIRDGLDIQPLLTGGGQEYGRRAGTENLAGIVALGKACDIAMREMESKMEYVGALRARLENGIMDRLREVSINGHPVRRIYNTCNISFSFIEAEALLAILDMAGIAVSSGSACSSGSSEPSRVLTAMGLEPVCSRGAVRFSLGMGNTEGDVDYCLDVLVPAVERLQRISPFFPA